MKQIYKSHFTKKENFIQIRLITFSKNNNQHTNNLKVVIFKVHVLIFKYLNKKRDHQEYMKMCKDKIFWGYHRFLISELKWKWNKDLRYLRDLIYLL